MSNHELSDNSLLKVVKASAGSGKTHRLTGEFLELLFDTDLAYKHILAVTFTNKATEEMKTRVVEELAHLAASQKSDYLQNLMIKFDADETRIREKSKKILEDILHDYSSFSISTIDRFFQQVMRAFAREIGARGGYSVELDEKKVLEEAIDSLFSDLEKPENKPLLEWLIRFSEEEIEEGKGWNVRKNIGDLAREIFKEDYKTRVDRTSRDVVDKQILLDYKKELSALIAAFENRLRQIGERGVNVLHRFGLSPDDFNYGKSSTLGSFIKWANGEVEKPGNRFLGLQDNLDVWSNKKTPGEIKDKMAEAYHELNGCITEVIEQFSDTQDYQTAVEINRNYYTLGILSDIDAKVREYCAANNLMLLSDTTELLSKVIEGTDTPFVYEKIGNWINHYMIDEFQDTSSLQWANFLPLLKNSLASGFKNLIVGDVKQSIYRWRNSDWKLLNEQLDRDFSHEGIEHDSLDVNWRSACHVVQFNNSIFESCAALLQKIYNSGLPESSENSDIKSLSHKILDAYAGLVQKVPEKNEDNEGHVKVEFIDGGGEVDKWRQEVLEKLPSIIEGLQDKGYCLKDISILVRTNGEGFDVANRLLEYKQTHSGSKYKYDIVSDEALLIANSEKVQDAVALLRHMKNPLDESLKVMAVYAFKKETLRKSTGLAVSQYLNAVSEFSTDEQIQIKHLSSMPLYEMVEEIFSCFHSDELRNEDIYIQAFLDLVLEFTLKNSSDLNSFLRWWDESGVKKAVFTPSNQDALRIMTIHKSKGLGFGVVIVPFCDWKVDTKNGSILWCNAPEAPFNKINPIPLRYSSRLAETYFQAEYFNEKIHGYIDNLNVMYVAFTRAKNELYVLAPKPKDKAKGVNNVAALLWESIGMGVDGENLMNLGQYFDTESSTFEVGEGYHPKLEVKSETVEETKAETLTSIPFDKRLKLRINNRYFFSKNERREFGSLMHEVVSQIEFASDLDTVIDRYVISGDLSEVEKNAIIEKIKAFISSNEVKKWYSGEYKVLNEVDILLPDGNFVRPDRVMLKGNEAVVIDYKFGEKEEPRYYRQVEHYIRMIRQIGYGTVTGYVCYVSLGKIVKVA